MTALAHVSLNDKFTQFEGRIFLTGTQALVRLPMLQHLRDAAAGYNTAGYISGYRGSPLGGFDQQLTAARTQLAAHDIVFQPGVNEDLAATAIWGTQQSHLNGENRFDGVFGIWYGKGPGVDRTGDAFRHANLAGTAPRGGVLALMGDDHTCESSTTAHQSEYALVDAMMPILNPAGVQEILDYGLIGWAMSRYAGLWVGLKCVKDNVEATSTVSADIDRVKIALPTDFAMPEGGLNIRWPDPPLDQEARLHRFKLDAARAFARANRLDKTVVDAPDADIGVLTTGKSYLDTRQAMLDLGIDDARAAALGLRLYKVGMTFPLEPEGLKRFAQGLDLVVVVEEKRALLEWQAKEILYGTRAPAIVGKRDEAGATLFQAHGALEPIQIALALAERILARREDPALRARYDALRAIAARTVEAPAAARTPYFCSGCPHNSSTHVPEGSVALAGIGCHYLAQFMERNNARYTQMGAEGAAWVGEARFSKRSHVFQNIGDGTYFHSGLLAIRAAIASGVNITYKILYNDAVAMTGGQPVDGQLTVPQITHQVASEGAKRVVVVTDEPEKYGDSAGFAPGTTVHHRDELDLVQRELREIPGCTVLVYDQTCATEKRRRRKRNAYPDPPKRAFINDSVCEGCGDCGVKSNCVSIVPLETEMGRKRAIDQSSCNKDFSCVKGFCPSFVTVHGGALKKAVRLGGAGADMATLPEPDVAPLDRPYGIIVTGIGGTGVVTIGAIVGMAAHLEGKGYAGLDMIGMAQKGGAVVSHCQIAPRQEDIKTARVGAGGADLILGCDVVTTAGKPTLSTVSPGHTRLVVNTQQTMTGDFTRRPDMVFPLAALEHGIVRAAGAGQSDFVDASRLATGLLGDSIATNMFMLGYAYQKGWLPVSAAAVRRAIELNGAAVALNLAAFDWGRRAVVDPAGVAGRVDAPAAVSADAAAPQTLDQLLESRVRHLTAYQNAAYAARYSTLVERVRTFEQTRFPGKGELAAAVARYYAKLLAYKDEYEVARLYTDGEFLKKLGARFEGEHRLHFHLAPPLLARRDPQTGLPMKREYGPWIFGAFKLLARLKGLRGTALDIFGYTEERKMERALILEYEALVTRLLNETTTHNYEAAVELARWPEHLRGFGHVKARHLAEVRVRQAELLQRYAAPPVGVAHAA